MDKDTLQHILTQLQAEFHQEAETLSTLQNIYAEKIKQIRANRAFPPDIQQRFLLEWEQFYNQRVAEIFHYQGLPPVTPQHQQHNHAAPPAPEAASQSTPEYGIETVERRPSKN